MRFASFVALIFLSLGVAGVAIAVYGFLPLGALVHPDRRATFEAQRVGIYAHILASAVALALGPFDVWSHWSTAAHPRNRTRRERLQSGERVLVNGASGGVGTAAGRFKSCIDRRYRFEQIVDAHRSVDQGHKRRNVVMSI